jgi:hypothetical protein
LNGKDARQDLLSRYERRRDAKLNARKDAQQESWLVRYERRRDAKLDAMEADPELRHKHNVEWSLRIIMAVVLIVGGITLSRGCGSSEHRTVYVHGTYEVQPE